MRITSSETIYDALKDEIIFLRRKPGDEISPQEVSERFDVSRSPVRDALMRLRSDALVVMRPQRGCWVSRIDLGKVEDERFFRLALEKSAIERFKDYMKLSDITRIEYFIELQKEALESGDTVGFYNADDDMHAIFFEATGLTRIWQLILRETSNHRRMRILSMGSDEILRTNLELNSISSLRRRLPSMILRVLSQSRQSIFLSSGMSQRLLSRLIRSISSIKKVDYETQQ